MSDFTSRLPKLATSVGRPSNNQPTSIRRPSNHHSTSARRPSNPNDASNIPKSVGKQHSMFTPLLKQTIQAGLFSTSRKSSINTDKKYQRPSKPAPDREEQIRMFENLIEFLRERDPSFPLPEAKRFFSSVSTTECSRIFEFLIGRIFDDFKINKLEIDVPEALASLEYPYIRTVTKSALVSITTRQAIINLLVIFDWLVNFCIEIEVDDAVDIDDVFCDNPILSSILANPSEPFEELERKMRAQASGNEPQLESLKSLIAERDRLNEQWEELQKVEVEAEALAGDLEECQRYELQMSEYLKVKNEQLQLMKQRYSEYQIEFEETRNELDKLSPIVDLEQPDCESDTYDDILKKLEQVEEEIKNERQFETNRKELDRKKNDLDRKKEINRQRINELRAEKMAATESFDNNRRNLDRIIEANNKHFKITLESYKMDMDSELEKVKASERRLDGVFSKIKGNNKIVRAARRKLVRHNLSKVDKMNKP